MCVWRLGGGGGGERERERERDREEKNEKEKRITLASYFSLDRKYAS